MSRTGRKWSCTRNEIIQKFTITNTFKIGGGIESVGSITFGIANGNDMQQFVQKFDRYKILHVRVRFLTRAQKPLAASTHGGGVLTHSLDFDDGSLPTNFAECLNRQNSKINEFHRGFSVGLTPVPSGTFREPMEITLCRTEHGMTWQTLPIITSTE